MTDATGMSSIAGTSGSNAQLAAEVSLAVARMAQDAARTQGDAAVALLEQAVTIQRASTAGAAGRQGVLDLRA